MRRLPIVHRMLRSRDADVGRDEQGRRPLHLARRWRRPGRAMSVAFAGLVVAALTIPFAQASYVADTEAPSGPGAYVLTATWTSNTTSLPPDAWRKVTGIDIAADGRIFIADAGERRITYLDANGRSHVLVPPGGPNGVVDTGHLGVDSEGNRLYVADVGIRSVAVYDLNGNRVATWGNQPNIGGLAVTPDGNVVITRNDTGELAVYSPEGFQLTKFLAVAPTPGGDLIRGVDVDSEGRMYVIDRPGRRILVYTAEGRRIDTIVPPVAANTEMIDLAVDYDPKMPADRGIWLATVIGLFHYDISSDRSDPYRIGGMLPAVAYRKGVGTMTVSVDRVGRGSSLWLLPPGAGSTTAPVQFGGYITQLGILDRPERIAIGDDDRAYILDVPPRIIRYGLDGVPIGQVVFNTTPVSVPVLVDAGPDGSIYATNGTYIMAYDPNNDGRRPPRWQQPLVPPSNGPPIPGQPPQTGHAVGLVYDPTGNEVVVLDALAGELVRFAATDGARGPVTRLDVLPTDTPVWTDLAADSGGTLYAYDRAARKLHAVSRGRPERLVGFSAPSRQMAGGQAGQLFTLERDGWVRRWDVSPAVGANAVRTAAFDASRFDRGASRPTDLAIDAGGDVYVVDRAANVVSHYRWDPNGTPGDPLEGTVCRATTAKTAAPNQIDLGQSVTVMLSISGGCGSIVSDEPLDVMLILDRSASMADGNKMNTLREAAMNFVAEVDFSKTQVGVVSFTTAGRVEARLGVSSTQVRQAIASLQADPAGGTAIDAGLAIGRDQYNRGRRQGVKGIFILISDGVSNYDDAVTEADAAKRLGVEIYAIGIQAFAPLMQAVATDRDHYFPADSARYLYGIFEDILEKITSPSLFSSLTVRDALPNNMRLVVGTVAPTATQQGAALVWNLTDIKPGTVTMQFNVTPQQLGCWPTNTSASADYVDGFGNVGQLTFPVPQVCVREPAVGTPTPTNTLPPPTDTPIPTDTPVPTSTATRTATPTPTLTPVPKPIYLPVGIREQCKPGEKYADVMLVIDTSNSMVGPPLDAAKEAARLFVGLLALPNDQIGLVAFNAEASLSSPLTGSRAALEAVIANLTTQPGTRIDRGLETAIAELNGPRHKPANTPVIVLLTDGVGEETTRAVQLAGEARAKGARIYAIGLGSDIDLQVLQSISGSSGRTYVAPGLADLALIYRQVAGQVPCPAESFWGRR